MRIAGPPHPAMAAHIIDRIRADGPIAWLRATNVDDIAGMALTVEQYSRRCDAPACTVA